MERFEINSNNKRHRFPESHAGQKKVAIEEMWMCLQLLKDLGDAVVINKDIVKEISVCLSKGLAKLESIIGVEENRPEMITAPGALSSLDVEFTKSTENSAVKWKSGACGRRQVHPRKNSTIRNRKRRRVANLEDDHSWRKYGQKSILGARHPRCYYRCRYKISRGCRATRQVQKNDHDDSIYDISYFGDHTCRDSPENRHQNLDGTSMKTPCLISFDSPPHSMDSSNTYLPQELPESVVDVDRNALSGCDLSFLSELEMSPLVRGSEHGEGSSGSLEMDLSLEGNFDVFDAFNLDPGDVYFF